MNNFQNFNFIGSFCAILSMALATNQGFAAGVDLHAHLFMKKGIPPLIRGDFFEAQTATRWDDRFKTNATADSLEKSGLNLVVASLYAHPALVWDMRDSIRLQVAQAQKFVQTNKNWVLAKNPQQAKEAIKNNKRVLILSLEGASGILETKQDFEEFVNDLGISIVAPMHLMDDPIGGVAILKSWMGLSSPLSLIQGLFDFKFWQEHKMVKNPNGLGTFGKTWIKLAHQYRVWIDFAHASDRSFFDVYKQLQENRYPVLITHSSLRQFHVAERATPDTILAAVANTQGFFGLMPSEQMLQDSGEKCVPGVVRLKQHLDKALEVLKPEQIALGADWNGLVPHLNPCDDSPGIYSIEQELEIYSKIELKTEPQNFIETWSRAVLASDALK